MNDRFLPGSEDEQLPFEFRRKNVPDNLREENWEKIEKAVAAESPVYTISWKKYAWTAAASLLLILASVWFFRSGSGVDAHDYKTSYSQVKHITLPDGSKVTLNANSELRLSADWSDKGDRQVWLQGEAYFEVEKKPATHQKFIVHTNDLDVEVLGTKFNVNTRHEKSVVALEEGKIRLSVKSDAKAVQQKKVVSETIEMKPGEVVKLDTDAGLKLAAEANINFHSGWVRNEFHFDNTSLQEIAVMIKDVYGYTMEVKDPALLQRKVSGDLRAANLNELVDVLQLAFRLKMTFDNKKILVSMP